LFQVLITNLSSKKDDYFKEWFFLGGPKLGFKLHVFEPLCDNHT
jgi:hypothetical protein